MHGKQVIYAVFMTGLEPSSEHFGSVQRIEISMQKTMDLSQLVSSLSLPLYVCPREKR